MKLTKMYFTNTGGIMSQTVRPIAQLFDLKRQARNIGIWSGVLLALGLLLTLLLAIVYHLIYDMLYLYILMGILIVLLAIKFGYFMSVTNLARLKKDNHSHKFLSECGKEFNNDQDCLNHEYRCNLCSAVHKAVLEKGLLKDQSLDSLTLALERMAIIDQVRFNHYSGINIKIRVFTALCQERFDSYTAKQAHTSTCPICLTMMKWRFGIE